MSVHLRQHGRIVGGIDNDGSSFGGSAKLTVQLRPGAYVLSDPVGLGQYNVMFLDVVRAAVLRAKGDGSVVAPEVEPPPMCGVYYTP